MVIHYQINNAFQSEISYLIETASSINGSSLGRILILSPGVHTFPFKLGLPLGLPSTFLGKHGWVQYYCRTELREPGGPVHKNHQVFVIMNPIDLNLEPVLITVRFYFSFILSQLFHLISNRFIVNLKKKSECHAWVLEKYHVELDLIEEVMSLVKVYVSMQQLITTAALRLERQKLF